MLENRCGRNWSKSPALLVADGEDTSGNMLGLLVEESGELDGDSAAGLAQVLACTCRKLSKRLDETVPAFEDTDLDPVPDLAHERKAIVIE